MDVQREESAAYEYLCHLEEAKNWMEDCLKISLPAATELEENLRNGVVLAKLGHYCSPHLVPLGKIFDSDEAKYKRTGLHFKHTDNINFFIQAVRDIGLSEVSPILQSLVIFTGIEK